MKAPELYDLSYSLGKKILEPKGFVFQNGGSWTFQSPKYILAFELANISKLEHFNIKFLTLVFYNYVKRSDFVPLEPGKYADKCGPIQINPLKLKGFVESGCSEDSWHYVNPYTNGDKSNTYHSLYYGGIEKQKFISKFSRNKSIKPKVARDSLFIEKAGAEVISEIEATKVLEKAIRYIAEYSFKWADRFTSENIIQQIECHGEDCFTEKEWVKAYQSHLEAQ